MKISKLAPALVLALTVLAGCHGPARDPLPTRTESAPLPTVTTDSPSTYGLHLGLRDFDGATIGVDVFRGHPVIVSMFYGSCPAACPLIVSNIKRIEAELPPEVRADLRVLLVSFDAARDTPEALRELARAQHVDTTRWRFASAPDDEARQLANVLGVDYRAMDDGIFAHNSVISVLDREGRIVTKSDDASAPLDPLVAAVR
jgi:protein SCO1/2